MKEKTIKAVLSKVHKSFIDSIDDERVKKLVNENSMVSGGSITSMLLNEKVNDFDYYFTNRETVEAVAGYYLNKFKKLHPNYNDISLVVRDDGRIYFYKNGTRNVIGEQPEEAYEEVLERQEDEDKQHLDDVRETTAEEKPKFQPSFITSNAISLTGRIQLVLRFYGTPEEIHKNFDFVHATCYWTSKSNHLQIPRDAVVAMINKELRYVGSLYPICSLFRARKFIRRGWQINAGQFVKMAWQISKLDLSNIDTLRDQLVGVDSVYFEQAIEALQKKKEEDPNFTIDGSYLFKIIDRIF